MKTPETTASALYFSAGSFNRQTFVEKRIEQVDTEHMHWKGQHDLETAMDCHGAKLHPLNSEGHVIPAGSNRVIGKTGNNYRRGPMERSVSLSPVDFCTSDRSFWPELKQSITIAGTGPSQWFRLSRFVY
jgi:hypothetical protein